MQPQCAIPVFDGLLPEPHNTCVLQVLFDLAHWHGLAKLRMHTDSTLKVLLQVTTALGDRLRTFQEQTCSAFPTRELQREQTARLRRQVKKTVTAESGPSKSNTNEPGPSNSNTNEPGPSNSNTNKPEPSNSKPRNNGARRPKKLNLRTYKFHSLGDYHYTIRRFGTIDSYSTQSVSFLSTFAEPRDINYLLE
jgi:hypothetical protein